MEPSLRSSTQRGVECKLRRTESALHEATQRFVESLCPDVRISQYADLNFAAKKISNDRWCLLEPVPGGRVGYLIFAPNRPAVWIDDQFKQSVCVQMRVDMRIYQKPSVFIASLTKSIGLLRIEDAWMLANESLLEIRITQRWKHVLDLFHDSYKPDMQLQQGLRIEPATFHPLTQFTKLIAGPMPPTVIFAQGETAPRRLRIQTSEVPPVHAVGPMARTNNRITAIGPTGQITLLKRPQKVVQSQAQAQAQSDAPMFIDSDNECATKETTSNNGIAKAVAHEEYPDTYNLSVNGVKKGYAAVQDLALSRQLRLATKENKDILVRIEWNEEFKMYEILSQV